jgi:hypothetical protein
MYLAPALANRSAQAVRVPQLGLEHRRKVSELEVSAVGAGVKLGHLSVEGLLLQPVLVPFRVMALRSPRGHGVQTPTHKDPELRVPEPLRRRPRVERFPRRFIPLGRRCDSEGWCQSRNGKNDGDCGSTYFHFRTRNPYLRKTARTRPLGYAGGPHGYHAAIDVRRMQALRIRRAGKIAGRGPGMPGPRPVLPR